MSTPASSSGRSGEACTSLGLTDTGRRLAKRPSALRIAKRPCSGRTLARGSSHFGPPTAPSSTASAARADLQRLRRQRRAGLVDGDAADERVLQREGVSPLLADRRQHTPGLIDDFRADSVTGQNCNHSAHSLRFLRFRAGARYKKARGPQATINPVQRRAIGVAAAGAERLAGDLQTGRHLAPFVFALLDAPDDVARDRRIEALRHQRRQVEPADEVRVQNRVQQIVGG